MFALISVGPRGIWAVTQLMGQEVGPGQVTFISLWLRTDAYRTVTSPPPPRCFTLAVLVCCDAQEELNSLKVKNNCVYTQAVIYSNTTSM